MTTCSLQIIIIHQQFQLMIPNAMHIQRPNFEMMKNLSKTKADFYVTLQDKIFPLHKELLQPSHYLTQVCSHEKFHIIEEPFPDMKMFQKVLRYFYGEPIVLTETKQLETILPIIDFLGITEMKAAVEELILADFHNYDIFEVLGLAYQFCLQKAFELGLAYLEHEQFEQINYNMFDLIRCDFKLFQIILRRHHILKISGEIYGQPPETIEQIIRLYCRQNQYNQQTLERLLKKYVKNLKEHEVIKQSLRLQKLAHKKIVSSRIFEAHQQQPNRLKKSEQSREVEQAKSDPEINTKINPKINTKINPKDNPKINPKDNPEIEMKKQGEISKIQSQKPMKNSKFSTPSSSFQSDQVFQDLFMMKINICEPDFSNEEEQRYQELQSNNFSNENETIQSMTQKIEALLGHYETAYKEHEDNFAKIRNNVKLKILDDSNLSSSSSGSEQSEPKLNLKQQGRKKGKFLKAYNNKILSNDAFLGLKRKDQLTYTIQITDRS